MNQKEIFFGMKQINRAITAVFCAMAACVLLLILFAFETTAFSGKVNFALPQWSMMIIGLAVLFAAYAVSEGFGRGMRVGQARRIEPVFWLLVFAAQASVSFFTYFMPPWDAGKVIENAYAIAAYSEPSFLDNMYFSRCSNNIVLTLLDADLMRLFRAVVGDAGIERCTYVLIVVQCAVSACTGWLTQWTARSMTDSRRFSWAVAAGYVLLVSLSPWVMIPYSDGFALLFPMLTLVLYIRQQTAKNKVLYWAAIGAAAAFGYWMKPQGVIMLIAVGIVETARLLSERAFSAWLKRFGAMAAVLLLLVVPVKRAIISASPFEIDPEADIGVLHYVMLGCNQETDGTVSHEDKVSSYGIERKAERTQMQLETIADRLRQMHESGTFFDHLKKKTLVNYADGTFAWEELAYPASVVEEKDGVISPLLRSIIWADGSRHSAFAVMLHSIWMGVLALCVLALPAYRESEKHKSECTLAAMMLALIGITLFETIFEARARYLFIYAPTYLTVGMMGLRACAEHIKKKRKPVCGFADDADKTAG